jgi:hypothetical protein
MYPGESPGRRAPAVLTATLFGFGPWHMKTPLMVKLV